MGSLDIMDFIAGQQQKYYFNTCGVWVVLAIFAKKKQQFSIALPTP